MNFESSLFDYHNQIYGLDFPDYPPVHQDTSISISAVVSASCVIVNDLPPQQDTSPSQFHFPPDSLHTAYSDPGNVNHPSSAAPSDRHQDIFVADFNNVCTEQVPFPNSAQQPYSSYMQDRNCDAVELGCNAFPDTNSYSCYETDNSVSYGQQEQCPDICSENGFNYDAVTFDSNAVYTHPTTSVSSCDSFFPESPPRAEFEPVPFDKNPQSPLNNTVSVTQTSNFDVNVDEMIGSGVTVAGFKPRGIIRKRKKSKTPNDAKDGCYWSKRVKNNDSARRSRETKKEKERNFYKRALELEYENFYLKEKISQLESQLSSFSTGGNLG